LAIQKRLASDYPSIPRFQREVATGHTNLGILFSRTGHAVEARAEYEVALAIRKRLASDHPSITLYQRQVAASHFSLGNLLSNTGYPAEARAEYEAALAIRKRLAIDHPSITEGQSDLGAALNNLAMLDLQSREFVMAAARLREAVARQKQALANNPGQVTFRRFLRYHYTNLLTAARGLDDAEMAAEAVRGLAELAAGDPGGAVLDARIKAVLEGATLRDNLERVALAGRANDTRRHAAAAQLFAEALEADPKLAADRRAHHRYNAGCSAALAAAGEGVDSPREAAARARLRARALVWLQADLDAWKAVVATPTPGARAAVVATLRHWQQDSDLFSVRDPRALARLPNDEHSAWQALWVDVAGLAARASGAKPPTRPDLPTEVFAR
jgi:tetratricopeptide (TPR) repeat protein